MVQKAKEKISLKPNLYVSMLSFMVLKPIFAKKYVITPILTFNPKKVCPNL